MPGPDPNAPPADPATRVWVTLVTRSTYLPGVILLVHTLYKHGSKHSIIVQYTPSLGKECIDCLHSLNAIYALMRVQQVHPIPLPPGLKAIASRFDDTLTKLRAFEPLPTGSSSDDPGLLPPEPKLDRAPEHLCFLDADIMIFRNMDDIFNIPLPGPDWIAAHHACVCNVDSDPWAPPEWNSTNCAKSSVSHPEALDANIPTTSAQGARPTYRLLNSGVFVCSPSQELWERIQHFLHNDDRVKTFTFPDQNFLDVFFADHWVPIGWQYNASKTQQYWHTALWRDDEVRALHYIVDKPWENRLTRDGDGNPVGGYKGRDGKTHSWWWREYEEWAEGTKSQGDAGAKVLECVTKHLLC